jgi:hypothetical protein
MMTLQNNQSTNQTNNVARRAVIARLTISKWTATKHDKRVSKEVADTHNSDEQMGRYNKSLINKDAMKEIRAIESRIRELHYKLTLPWEQDGERILSAKAYFDYCDQMRLLQVDWNNAVRAFVAVYPNLVADAQYRLNGLFNPAEYPAVSEIANKFNFEYANFLPLPEGQHLQVIDMGTELADRQREVDMRVAAALDKATRDIWLRMQEVVTHMHEKLKVYERTPDGKTNGIFRDSLVENITDLLDLVPTLNFSDDPNINKIADDMRASLTQYSPDTLRENPSARANTASAAKNILDSISEFIA